MNKKIKIGYNFCNFIYRRFFMLKNKKIRTIFLLALILVSILGINYTQGMQNYQKLDFETGIVTASALNVRKGPSTSYDVITQIYKNICQDWRLVCYPN